MQSCIDVLPVKESEFDIHFLHTLDFFAPNTDEYVPFSQYTQEPFPELSLYLPGIHCIHKLPYSPANPVLHTQSWIVVLPSGDSELLEHCWHTLEVSAPNMDEYVPVPQFTQNPLPELSLYLPGKHCIHKLPYSPEYPGLHKQS